MTGFDYIVLIVLGLSVLVSVVRGAVREVMALASWVVSGFVAVRFAPSVSAMLPSAVTSPTVRVAAAFILVLVVCLMLFALLSLLLTQLMAKSGLNGTDRTLGALFGLARGLVILVLLVMLGGLTPLPHEPAWRNAVFSPPLEALAIYAKGYLPQRFTQHIRFDERGAPPA
jgi:membrane protein required for colicin V production